MKNKGYPAGRCVHFNVEPVRPFICGAGIHLEIWRDLGKGEMPCWLDENGHSLPNAAHCAHLRRPTPEEIAADVQEQEELSKRMGIVQSGIVRWRRAHKGKYACEVVECPACKGRLHLTIFPNGHVHGRCETEGCVDWME